MSTAASGSEMLDVGVVSGVSRRRIWDVRKADLLDVIVCRASLGGAIVKSMEYRKFRLWNERWTDEPMNASKVRVCGYVKKDQKAIRMSDASH